MKKKFILPLLFLVAVPLAFAAFQSSYIQTNFTSGELSPMMKGRVDVTKYDGGAAEITNFIPTQFGTLAKTPGTEFIGEVRDSTEAARLIPFQFSTEQTYILELNDSYMRFYRNRARIIGSNIVITGITNADPGVVTAVGHGLSDGDTTVINDVQGMTELNGNTYKVANKTNDTFELTDPATDEDIDTTNYGTYETDTDSVLILHGDLTIEDASASAQTVTANGDADTTISKYKFGGGSIEFDGADDYLTVADTADLDFGSGDFTIDAWVYFNTVSHPHTVISDYVGGTGWIFIINANDGDMRLYSSSVSSVYSETEFLPNTWYHVAVVRDGSGIKFFKDGVQQGITHTASATYNGGGSDAVVGVYADTSYFDGYMDELRVVKGVAEWTEDFDVPTSAYGSNGTITSIYEISQPYDATEIQDVQYAQTADVMYLAHEDYAPRKLSRTGHASWTLETVDFVRGPFMSDNTTATTITPDGDTGNNITLTANGNIFEAGHVGSLWRVKDGVVKIDGYTSATVVTGDVQAEADGSAGDLNTGPGATDDWAEGAWSDVNGWPRSVQFYEQRLVFAGTTEQPQTMWLSQSEQYENFDVDDASATDSMSYTIATDQVNAIQWLSAGKTLLMGTTGGIFSLSSGSDEDAITPSNVLVKKETSYGSTDDMPKRIGNYVYYVQSDDRTLRELSYSLELDGQKAANISLLSEHLLAPGVKEMDYQQSPHNVLWMILDDGDMATMTREIDQEVSAFALQQTDGEYENVAVIQSSNPTDGGEVWFVVQRTIDGSEKRFIELMQPFDWGSDDADQFYVHSGLTYDGASTTSLSGLEHLEGESVSVWAGDTFETHTVSGGAITLDSASTQAIVGLPYESTLVMLPLEIPSSIGSGQRTRQRINNAIVRVYDTRSINVGPEGDVKDQNLTEMTTGDIEVHVDFGYGYGEQLEVTSDEPNNCHIIAIIYQLLEQER